MDFQIIDTFSLISGVILSSVITLIGFYINSRNQEKEREFNLNKEIYLKYLEKLEIIFSGLAFYNANNRIIIDSIISGNHFEEDFMTHKIKEREGGNLREAQDLMYLYFSDENNELLKCMDTYKEVIDGYFEKIIKPLKFGNQYTQEDTKNILKNADKFNKELIKFMDSLKRKAENQKNNIV